MYLVEGNTATSERDEQLARDQLPSEPWETFPYSRLAHHGAPCCDIAREWVVAMDFAQLNGADLSSGPRWLRARYNWGPLAWPMHWCDVAHRETIDCGAHAALSREVFSARGLVTFPAQLVQRYSEAATDQWRGRWSKEDVSCHWLDGEHIYHEAAALLVGNGEVRIWDGSAGSWVSPRQPTSGYGSVVSVRIHADPTFVTPAAGFVWGERRIEPNAWNQLFA